MVTIMKKIHRFLLFLTIAFAFSACGRQGAAEHRELLLATGPAGGGYYAIGPIIAEALMAAVGNLTVTTVPSGGSVANPPLLGSGEVDLALTNYYSAWNAFHGVGAYRGTGRIPLVGIANLQYSILHLVVSADSDIYSVADLRGRRVNVGPSGGAGAMLFNMMIPFWDLSMQDIHIYNVAPAVGAQMIRDGELDVNVPHGAPPLGAVSNLAGLHDVRILNLEEEILLQILELYPYYDIAYIQAGTYVGIDAPVRSLGIQDILTVRQDMDEELAYQIARGLYESQDFLRRAHPALAGMSFDGFGHSLVRLHPGALRFYRERGISLE